MIPGMLLTSVWLHLHGMCIEESVVSHGNIVSIVLVLVQQCVACLNVQAQEVVNRLRSTIVETVILIVFLTGHLVIVGVWIAYYVVMVTDKKKDHFETDSWYFLGLIIPLDDAVIPFGFIIFFGRELLQELGCQCCCRRRRRQGYGLVQGQEEGGVGSTTRTTYYTCDDSQPSEWFRAAPAPDPPVQQ